MTVGKLVRSRTAGRRVCRDGAAASRAIALAALLAMLGAGTAAPGAQSAAATQAAAPANGPAGAHAGPPASAQPELEPPAPAVPVTIARATSRDVPIYLRGLGAVQAFQAVQVRARVDGTLMRVPVTEGQDVNEGDLIAEIDPRPFKAALDAALARQQQDAAQLANAQADLARYNSLSRQNYVSRQQVDTQQALVKQLTAQVAGDAAAVESARLNLGYCFITAPVQGRIGLRQIDPGNMVHATDTTPILAIAQIHPISVVFTLPQDELPRIAAAMAAGRLPVTALASDGRTALDQGTLLAPDNTIDSGTGTIKLKATFPNPRNQLWPGQFVNARLQLGVDRGVLTVPTTAIQHGPDNLYVYLVHDDTVLRQPVEVARDEGDVSVITDGLRVGQAVVTTGQSRLQQGTGIAPADPATPVPASPPGARGS